MGRFARHVPNCIRVALAIGLGTLSCMRAASGEAYTLDGLLGGGSKEVQLWVPTNGLVSVGIVRLSAGAPPQATLQIGAFRGEHDGQELDVRLVQTNLTYRSNDVITSATLQVAPIRALQKYHGTLALSTNGAPATVWRITLHDPSLGRPATLVVDRASLKHSIVGRWIRQTEAGTPQVTATLREKSGLWPVEGVGVSLTSVTAPERATFDLNRNVTFFLGTNRIPSLTESALFGGADRRLRTIPAGGHTQLGLGFHDLKAGQYTVELKLLALNSKPDEQQKLTITLQVAHSVWPALLTLLAALCISFFSYKWLQLYALRLSLRKRVGELRPGWLSYRDPVYSVVWVRTVLRQAERLASRVVSLLPPALITERIERVPPVLDALNQAGEVEEQLKQLKHLPLMVQHRLRGLIASHVRTISDRNMDKDVAGKAKESLAALNASLAGTKWLDSYRAEVVKAASAFRNEFDERAMPVKSPKIDALVQELKAGLATIETETDEGRIIAFDENYARLKVLYELRQSPEVFEKVLDEIDRRLGDVFRLADDAAWERVKKAPIRVHSFELDGNEPLEAYRPMKFYLTTGDKDLDATYLFNRGLHFEWKFTLRKWWRRTLKLKPKTHSPRVAQFAPHAGELSVSVEIVREVSPSEKQSSDENPKASMGPLEVTRSLDLGFLRGVELTEWCALAVASLLAIVSGLLTFYYKNPTFGSVQDYLSLFLWGVGVEQTKNFLQLLRSPTRDPET